MTSSKKSQKSRRAEAKQTARSAGAPAQAPSHAWRETIESLVIAFVLAFLFRTFEAEAFVIPTGSMAPTLMGRHKDVECPKCGFRYKVGASDVESENVKTEQDRELAEIVAGVCPMCRYAMPMRPDLPAGAWDGRTDAIERQKSYGGDRILVNKYLYTFDDPQRWDVIVFHFPGDAKTNYIKRLVGLPGETLRIFQGDLFVGGPDASEFEDFLIARKPPDKVLAMRQLVHDTNYDSAELYQAGWPLRWQATRPTGADGWQTETEIVDGKVQQLFTVDRSRGGEAWLQYVHRPPDFDVWNELAVERHRAPPGAPVRFSDEFLDRHRPQLITDFNAYNARIKRGEAETSGLRVDSKNLGLHWVGDLMIEADVEVQDPQGALLLELVEAGKKFTCSIELSSGQATLSITGLADFAPRAATPLSGTGDYRVALANVDDQLLLWVDDELMEFDRTTAYDAERVFGGRAIRPQTSAGDPGDLAPAGIGARDTKLTVSRLKLWRDIYYISTHWRHIGSDPISDYSRPHDPMIYELPFNPSLWDEFLRRRHEDFPLGPDQFFVMGDNSPESSDARLWRGRRSASDGQPGGDYLERDLLIGKAFVVYWPHAWYTVPGTWIPVWPNWKDMRLVR